MKKIVNRIIKIIFAIGAFILFIPKKVLSIAENVTFDYSHIHPVPLYGIERPTVPIPWKITRSFIIPLAFLVGIIIYFKKSKSSFKRKIIISIIFLVILCLLCFGINYLIINR